jgi:hypothetical protein
VHPDNVAGRDGSDLNTVFQPQVARKSVEHVLGWSGTSDAETDAGESLDQVGQRSDRAIVTFI